MNRAKAMGLLITRSSVQIPSVQLRSGIRIDLSGMTMAAIVAMAACVCSGCHYGNAEDSCEKLASDLYGARSRLESAGVRDVLSTNHDHGSEIAELILQYDKAHGAPGLRRSIVRVSSAGAPFGVAPYYKVMLGYRVKYASGEKREFIECKTDGNGLHPTISTMTLDPSADVKH